MRILHVIPSIDRKRGGPETALLGMAPAQARAGLDVTVLAGQWPGDVLPGDSEMSGVTLRTIGPCAGGRGRCPGMRRDVARAVAGADVVHLHGMWEEMQHLGARSASRDGVPYLFTPHGMLDRWALRQGGLKKRAYMLWRGRRNLRGAAAIHCTSRMEAQQVDDLKLGSPTFVEPLGVEWSEFERLPVRGAFRAAHPGIGERPLIVFLGRVHPGKGVEHLIPALAACREPRAVVAVVGPDSRGFLAQMEALAAARGVGDRVVFTGMLRGAEKIQALVDADLFALPSDHENFGMSVIEALAAGTPVVVSDEVNIHREIVEAGVGAVSSREPAALAGVLDRCLRDEALRRDAVAERARAFVRRTFNWETIAGHWTERYARLAAGTAGQRASAEALAGPGLKGR